MDKLVSLSLVLATQALLSSSQHIKIYPPVSLSSDAALSGWGDSDNVVRFDEKTIVAFTSRGPLVSTDNGWTYRDNTGGPLPGGVLWHPQPGVMQTLGVEIPKSRQGYNFSSDYYTVIESDGAGSLQEHEVQGAVVYEGLPREVTCKQGLPTDGCCGCPFRVGGHGSDDVVELSGGDGYVQTVNVFFSTGGGKRQGPSSLVCFHSADGLRWQYRALVADAEDFPESEEGPNESALVRLVDGSTLMAVVRMDGGDGPPDRKHSVLYQTFSRDGGRTWSRAQPMQPDTVLSVRPKLLMLNGLGRTRGPLLLTTGRPGIFLWVNWDGYGRNWTQVNIAAEHNARLGPAEQGQKFSPEVVAGTKYFSPYQSSVYNSLVQGNTSMSAILYYNRHSIKGYETGDAVYAMHIDFS